MRFLKEMSSLKKKALYQVAVNLSQDISFKETAMHLEKPTYGTFIRWGTVFTSDPKMISAWSKMEEARREGKNRSHEEIYRSSLDQNLKELWYSAIDEQCQRLTEMLPRSLKPEIHVWMNRIAFEYSSYSQRHEFLFGMSCYYFMKIITVGDWIEEARLNEEKLAKQMVSDEQLTLLQRFRIACFYCLQADIHQLWDRLTLEEKHSISGEEDPCRSPEKNSLVLLWSYYMNGYRHEEVTGRRKYLWDHAALEAVLHGNQAALMTCWRRLDKRTRQKRVISLASECLENWKSFRSREPDDYEFGEDEPLYYIVRFNLPSYYSNLLRFFLLEMNEQQQMSFFKQTFRKEKSDRSAEYGFHNVLDCFLEWPLWEHFLPMMNLLKTEIPKHNFAEFFLSLVSRYIGGDGDKRSLRSLYSRKEKDDNDYGNMLLDLWEEMPIDYRQYHYRYGEYSHPDYYRTVTERFLFMLLEDASSFEEKDEAYFKQVWLHLSPEERIAVIQNEENGICGNHLSDKWLLVNWLLENSLPDMEIPSFKRKLIKSAGLIRYLEMNIYDTVQGLIDWAYESDAEKTQFKYEMLKSGNRGLQSCSFFLSAEKFADAENMINFCLSSDEDKRRFKQDVGKIACHNLLKERKWELMDKIFVWSFDAEEKISAFKKELFHSKELLDIHYDLVFIKRKWGKVDYLYKWFNLTPEEILKIKKETMFLSTVNEDIFKAISNCKVTEILASLRWCLTDIKMVMNLRKEVEKRFPKLYFKKYKLIKVKEGLDYLMNELLLNFRK